MFEADGVVADRADVIGDEAGGRLLDRIVGDGGVVGLAEGAEVDEGEVGDVEEAFDLAAGGGVERDAVGEDLDVAGVVPFGEVGEVVGAAFYLVIDQAHPDEAVGFAGSVGVEVEAGRDGSLGMGGDADALAGAVVAEAVVFADEVVAFDVAHAERDSAMEAEVAGGEDFAVGEAVEDDAFVEEADGDGLGGDFVREGDGVPVGSEGAPVGFGEGAVAGERGGENVEGGSVGCGLGRGGSCGFGHRFVAPGISRGLLDNGLVRADVFIIAPDLFRSKRNPCRYCQSGIAFDLWSDACRSPS